ncbi:Vacuolar H+transporting two-sector ATPase F subunit [candidate division KSB3 bacterium]|uniref:Vacuolar H+transporting two-sector ATPase F subunit n=1 Tax=candidate division KSB3 bacterium TaxID=2044937 RepID=A0A9D5JW94_9BACT|nr:Vacuolar H+transporting two-sector ATPase F subunit [candidate division KSB3 bacterium]MBD3325280.1 Vacuolar H+transporting two-sector ATPase F subunit [candidate division KSB3 bacterium]
MKTIVIADEDTVLGFSLTGVQGIIVPPEAEDIRQAFEQAIQMEDIGILLITERIAEHIRETLDAWIIGGGKPLVVEIPDHRGPLPGRRTPHEFVKSAIGVKF